MIRTSLVGVALALGSMIAGGVSAAQQGMDVPGKEAEVLLAEFANCVVTRKARRSAVETFLRSIPNTESWYRNGLKAADMHCLDAAARRSGSVLTMRMPPSSFRDALYPALYRRDFGRAASNTGIAQLPPMTFAQEFSGDVATLPGDYRLQRALGDCVARSAPPAAHAFLLAKPWSPQEDAAVAPLKPALANCLPEGKTLSMNRAAMRAYIGEAMYKLSVAARPTA